MDQHAVHLVVPADALTPIHALLDTHGVGGLVVGAGHLVHVVVHEAEGGGVHHGGDVDPVLLQGLEQVGQLGPAGNALEHDAVLLGEGRGALALLDGLGQVLLQQLEGLGGLHLAAGGHHVGHVVEQIEAAVGGGLVLQVVTHAQPGLSGAVGVLTGVLELLLVELLAGDLLQLMDGSVELSTDISHVGVVDVHSVVVGDVDHDQGDVAHTGDVLIPLGHAVTDVVAAQHEVGLRHTHLTIRLDGLTAEVLVGDLLLGGLGQSLDLIDVIQHGVGLHGLGILLGLAGLGVDDHVAVLVLQRLAALGIDDILQGLGVKLPGRTLAGSISQADTGITADVVVVAQLLGSLTHDLTVTVGGDTSGLVLGVHHVQIKGLSQLAGELGAGPTNQLALGMGLAGISIHILDDLAQGLDAGAHFFSHCCVLLT